MRQVGPRAPWEALSEKWVQGHGAPVHSPFSTGRVDRTCLRQYSMTAYLVIREGSKWTDVFRLVDGESITVGRAPTTK